MSFNFIYGSDEYLTEKTSREKWAELSAGLDAEFGLEIIDGRCQKVEEVEAMARRFREAVQTMGLFGGARAVWLKSVNFISDSVVGRAQGTLDILEELKELLQNAKPEEVRILISATPVDKRLSFFKWLSSNGDTREAPSLEGFDAESLMRLAREKGLVFENEAADIFVKKVGGNARAVENELEKLALYLGATISLPCQTSASADTRDIKVPQAPKKVDADLVVELTSTVAEGEFFEPLEAFYSRKPQWALGSLHNYFATQKDASARPLLAAFFNRNRLLLLIKAALAEGLCRAGFKGLTWTPKADELKSRMGSEKTPFNLFAQNPWYLGRLAQEAERFTLQELREIQVSLLKAFENIHSQDEAIVMEGFVARWVGVKA